MIRNKKSGRNKGIKRAVIIFSVAGLLFVMAAGYAAFQTNVNINAKGNIIEKSRIIQSWDRNDTTDFHSDFYKGNIFSVTFLDTNKVPGNAAESWDVSEEKDRGVMAYVIQNTSESGKYDLYIGANGGVLANENSSYLFAGFTNVTFINFEKNFDTSNATDMTRMFSNCNSLTSLDVSSFVTNNVTSMFDMFAYTSNLKNLLGIENFNTNNVVNMQGMFHSCVMTSLNLCNFNTEKVTNMNYMFENTLNLNNVYVGLKWNTTNATTIHLWHQSNISSVTTGLCNTINEL